MIRQVTAPFLALLLLLPPGGRLHAQAQTPASRAPLLMPGKQSLYQRVIARPGATLSAAADGAGARSVPGFTVFYVYARPAGADGRIEVGRTADGRAEGWLEAAKAIDWKHTMVAAFTNPAGRQPLLFLRTEQDQRLLMMDAQAGQKAAALRATAQAAGPAGNAGPVLAIEPQRVVDFSRNFYLMPILSAERVEREFGPPLRLLEVISAPAEPPRPPPPPAPANGFKAGVVFVLDTTISMQPYIDRTREAIRGIIATIGNTPVRDNFRFGLVAYRDSLADSPGLEYSTRVFGKPDFNQPADTINTGVATAREATASSNGFDEDAIAGIKAALDETDWSPMAGRYIVLITDAGARTAQHPHSLTHLNIGEIRELAKAKGVAVFAIHLLTPEGRARRDHEPAAAQYQELTQFSGSRPLYFPVANGSHDAFACTVQDLSRSLLAQVGEAAGRPVAGPPPANPAIAESRARGGGGDAPDLPGPRREHPGAGRGAELDHRPGPDGPRHTHPGRPGAADAQPVVRPRPQLAGGAAGRPGRADRIAHVFHPAPQHLRRRCARPAAHRRRHPHRRPAGRVPGRPALPKRGHGHPGSRLAGHGRHRPAHRVEQYRNQAAALPGVPVQHRPMGGPVRHPRSRGGAVPGADRSPALTAGTAPALQARAVSRSFGAGGAAFTLLVEHLALPPGGRVAVTGPSGCGKSTMLALMGLALRPDAGELLALGGQDALAHWQAGRGDALAALRGGGIGFVPQTGALLPFLSLRDNILLPQRILGRPDPARTAALAARLGIAAVLDRMPAQVSVGQRQRAAVARALGHRPGVVLADEPTASVHPAQADEVLALLTEAAQEDGTALVITTHDAARAAAAGYAVAACRPAAGEALTRFAWPG